jgi:hypothetical protein
MGNPRAGLGRALGGSDAAYAVLYAYTPEIFPTKDRGTGNALTATANRIFGIMAVSDVTIVSSIQIVQIACFKMG